METKREYTQYYVSQVKTKFINTLVSEDGEIYTDSAVTGEQVSLEKSLSSYYAISTDSWYLLPIKDVRDFVLDFQGEKRISTLDEKINTVISDMEIAPLEFTSRDILDELKDHIENYKEIMNVKKSLTATLDDFAERKFGVPMDEETKKFLLNELVYLILKQRSGVK